MRKDLILMVIFCVFVTTNYLIDYSYDGVDYLIDHDLKTNVTTMLKPIHKIIKVSPIVIKHWSQNQRYHLGYDTCSKFCVAVDVSSLPVGSYYSNCWTFDEQGKEKRIIEQRT